MGSDYTIITHSCLQATPKALPVSRVVLFFGACAVANARQADAVSGYAAGAGGDSTGSGAAY